MVHPWLLEFFYFEMTAQEEARTILTAVWISPKLWEPELQEMIGECAEMLTFFVYFKVSDFIDPAC